MRRIIKGLSASIMFPRFNQLPMAIFRHSSYLIQSSLQVFELDSERT